MVFMRGGGRRIGKNVCFYILWKKSLVPDQQCIKKNSHIIWLFLKIQSLLLLNSGKTFSSQVIFLHTPTPPSYSKGPLPKREHPPPQAMHSLQHVQVFVAMLLMPSEKYTVCCNTCQQTHPICNKSD